MDVLPSTEFRKTYAKLTEVTIVTVNGHPIGEWHPASRAFERAIEEARPLLQEKARQLGAIAESVERFNSRPFTPVPKTTTRR